MTVKCPFCSHADSRVIDSRPTDEGGSIRRRRECQECQKRFTTYEIVENLPLMVIKKDGSREPFDRNKLIGGFIKACEKRPISLQQMERAATEIEQTLYNRLDREVTTQQIGEFAMEKLRNIDEVAYVRFASVYRQFADIKTIMDEVAKLLSEQ